MLSTPPLSTVALSGGIAGMTVDFIFYPLDTIKTRLQARRGVAVPQLPSTSSWRGFYRGLASALAGSFPAGATFWTAYTASKNTIVPMLPHSLAFVGHGVSSTIAEFTVCSVRTPFEVVKQQMQAGLHNSTGVAIRTIFQTDGMRGFYAGFGSTFARDIPFSMIQFALYEAIKSHLISTRSQPDLVAWENSAVGMFAGGVAAAATTPLDVIKTRLMTQTRTNAEVRYKGWLDAFRRVYAEEGAATLFSGIRPRVTWISFGGAIYFGTYEELLRLLQPQKAKHTGPGANGAVELGADTGYR